MITLFILLLCSHYFENGIITTAYVWFCHYIGHIILHIDHLHSIYSIPHRFHHFRNDWFIYILNVLAEFSYMTMGIILPKYIFFSFLNDSVVFFNYIIYTTVHYINYTYFKVNQYHVKHHELQNTNYYPDVFDKIFQTNHPETKPLEDMTHMIPNILFAFFLVNVIKPSQSFLYVVWAIVFIILLVSSISLLKTQIDTTLEGAF
jgi:hypothetical protein